MDTSTHTIQALFCQLGLANNDAQIAEFIENHKPLPSHISLYEAHFWNPAQVEFLMEAIKNDSDWCQFVDQLDCLLRQ